MIEENEAIAAAKKKENEAQTAKNATEQIKRQQKSLIQGKAKELNSQFRNKWMFVAAILVTHSLLSTVLIAFNSEHCVWALYMQAYSIDGYKEARGLH